MPLLQGGAQWGLSRVGTFPKPHEPATKDHMCGFLENAQELSQPNVLVAHCFENSMPMPAFDALRWRLMQGW